MNSAAQKLEAAISKFDGSTGDIDWSVSEQEGGSASLVATYSESHTYEDEPWTQFGGDIILEIAGFDRCNGGMDSYQDRFGANFVCQWTILPMIEHDTIVIRAPLGTKTRWVRQSQAQRRKLGDWIVDAVDRPANKTVGDPCKCGSFVLVSNGPGWQCAMCGVDA